LEKLGPLKSNNASGLSIWVMMEKLG
jgi:hypothetical protein